MDKIKIIIINQDDRRYAVFRVNPQFAGNAFRAGYRDLPRDKERVEVQPGDEEKLVAELRAKIAAAEAAIEQHAKFLRLPTETRELNVAGHRVTIEFSPSEHFLWKARVFIPTALKNELNSPTLLGTIWDAWQDEEDGRLSLFDITKDKEEYLERVKKEMTKVAAEIRKMEEWRAQPPQHYVLPGNVQVTISPHPQWALYYEAEVIVHKALIEKAKEYGLKLGNVTWWSKDDHHMALTYPLRDSEAIATFIDNIRSEVEETLSTEIVAQYSV
jgi:hypothetical protein